MNRKDRRRKENIINGIKMGILLAMMTCGFYLTYCLIWATVGLPLTEWALLVNMAVATLTELAYMRWITR